MLTLFSVLLLGSILVWSPALKADTPFIGEIRMFGGSFAPRNWVFCNGQTLDISSFTELFAVLGITYGGDGRTTVGVPDMKGRAPMHAGSGSGLTTRRLGEKGGVETVTLTANQIPVHTHTATSLLHATSTDGTVIDPTGAVLADDGRDRIYNTQVPDVTMSAESITTTVNNAGGGGGHPNMMPYTVVNFIIATSGIFPPQS
ncbi:MAG: tail fiber protein [Gammaproteobacteria bacterium]|nr:tail fiber protein [Gammaproteobacteria bacterium]